MTNHACFFELWLLNADKLRTLSDWHVPFLFSHRLHFEKEWKFLSRVKSSDTDQRQKQAPNDWNNASSNPLQQNSANGYNGEQTQPHGVQETSVSDISSYTKRPDCFSSQDGCDSSSNLLSWAYSNIIPYKRKRTVESDAGNESHWSNSETVSTNQNSHSFLASQVLPYKSKRTESSVSNSLIQTPLLSGEKFSWLNSILFYKFHYVCFHKI